MELKSAVTECLKLFPKGHCTDGPHGPIDEWDVSSVTDMSRIFSNANLFAGDISEWDVSSVTDMGGIFSYAKVFNGDISNWDVSKVRDMSDMFRYAKSFNSELSNWDVSRVTDMPGMFRYARSFDGDISEWDVSNVRDMSGMFRRAESFVGPVSDWDVSSVVLMTAMFRYALSFNDDISDWDVSNVVHMDQMFWDATSFEQELCGAAWINSRASKVVMFMGSLGSISGLVCTDYTPAAFAPESKKELISAVDSYHSQFEVLDVEGGGDCLFQSISLTESWADNGDTLDAYGVDLRARELRVLANDFLCPDGKPSNEELNGLPIELIIEPINGEDGEEYCARMREDGEWGSAAEILALTQVLNRPILVYQRVYSTRQGVQMKELEKYGSELEEQPKSPLSVLYVMAKHYMALLPNDCYSSGASEA